MVDPGVITEGGQGWENSNNQNKARRGMVIFLHFDYTLSYAERGLTFSEMFEIR